MIFLILGFSQLIRWRRNLIEERCSCQNRSIIHLERFSALCSTFQCMNQVWKALKNLLCNSPGFGDLLVSLVDLLQLFVRITDKFLGKPGAADTVGMKISSLLPPCGLDFRICCRFWNFQDSIVLCQRIFWRLIVIGLFIILWIAVFLRILP